MRHDVYGFDALAWALLADGQPRAAARFATRSLALGTSDPRLLAHAGLVLAAAGDASRATDLLTRALALSPTVDPTLMNRAESTLSELQAGGAS